MPDMIKYAALLIYLFIALQAFPQQDINKIEASFNEYRNSIFKEKVFAHTDKEFYLAGEITWFKLYVTNADNNKVVDLSKVAYVEIIDANRKPVLQAKVELKGGTGDGSLYLPVSLNSGVYKFRAYTNWMKNFSAEYFFEKPLRIVNTLKKFNMQPASLRDYDVQFFPEGGNLVQGIKSMVAFRLADQSGKGINAKGFVISNSGDTITFFQPLKFGMGRFAFTPDEGKTYRAILQLEDTTITRKLPDAIKQGYVMAATGGNGSQLNLRLTTNIPSADFVYVFVHTRGEANVAEKVFLRNAYAEFIIDKNKLGEGIAHITVFDKDLLPVCERLYFMRPRHKLGLQITTDEYSYTPRKPVSIRINAADESGTALATDLSVAVHPADSLETSESAMIDSYCWLTSELKGNVESPAYYFSEKGPEVEEATDNLMLTQGWRRFTWQDVLNGKKPAYAHVPEFRGHIIYGKVTGKRTGAPVSGVVIFLSVPGTRVQLYGSRSDAEGIVRFYTKDFYGPNDIVLQVEPGYNDACTVEISDPFSDKYASGNFPPFQLPDNTQDLLTDYSTGMQVQNQFNPGKLSMFVRPTVDSTAFFGPPYRIYNLDDYTRFSTMEEVLKEYVFEVLVRRQRDDFRLMMVNPDWKIFMDDPLTLLNGVPVFDANKMIKYDPLKVREIRIVKDKYYYGPLVLNGIANFVTYQPDPEMIASLNALVLAYEGMQYQREFYAPVYETEDQFSSRLPDFRNVLFWSPAVRTDAQGNTEFNFYTSDRKGRYIAVVQGIDSEGRVGERSVFFEVK